MDNIEKLLQILDEGAFITSEEMAELAKQVRALQQDAERMRWLTRYAGQLFMCSEQVLNDQIDLAMGKRK